MEKNKTVLIVAGEASGDQHAAGLVREIKCRKSSITFWGLGGARLKNEGVDVRADLVSLAVIGFSEVLKHLKMIRAVYKQLLCDIDRERPDLAILVDYPGFNLHLAKDLKKRGIPVIYYISPQIWAWGKGRIKTIKETVSRMIVLFPFEETLYRQYGIPVSFVGHPSLDHVKPEKKESEFRTLYSLDPSKRTIGLLPGSRQKEVKTLLPIMLDTAGLIKRNSASPVQFIVLAAPTVPSGLISSIVQQHGVPVTIVNNMTYEGIAASDFCLVCSGTATLETAIMQRPFVIVYKMDLLNYLLYRPQIKIPYVGMVNIVAGKEVVPEFIQFNARPEMIARAVLEFLRKPGQIKQMLEDLDYVKTNLGSPGAAERAAKLILDFLQNK